MAKTLRELVDDSKAVEAVYILHKDGQTTVIDPRQDDERSALEVTVDDIFAVALEAEDGSISLPFVPGLARANILFNIQLPIQDIQWPAEDKRASTASDDIPAPTATCSIAALTASWQRVDNDVCEELGLDPDDPRNRCRKVGNCKYCYRNDGGSRVCKKCCSS